MPASDCTLRVTLEMLEQVLAHCAMRAGHEMAWMAEEAELIEPYAADVAAVLRDQPTIDALEAMRAGRPASLHLDDHCAHYHLAGEALSCAVEAAMAADHRELTARGVALLEARRDRESDLRPNFFFPGRS
jgi:hypothetical protein